MLYLQEEKVRMYLRSLSFKSANLKKDWDRKSQIRKTSHLRKVRKSNKLVESANLPICGRYLRDFGKKYEETFPKLPEIQ
jgi:hypothetical protein